MIGRVFARRRRQTWAAFAAATLSLLLAREAAAFCRTTTCDPNRGDKCRINNKGCIRDGVPLVWKSLPIVYRFHKAGSAVLDDSAMRAAVRRAFDAWENVECRNGRTSLRFQEGPDISKDKPLGAKEASEKFGIYFRDDEWPHENEEESLALTNQMYGTVSGTIDYADIEINTATTNFRLSDDEDGIDFQAVMTHEVGHYIGLAHSNDPESIMVSSYCQSDDRCGQSVDRARNLAEDDILAVCAAYPPASKTAPVPEGGCTQGAGTTGGVVLDAAALLFLSAAVLRRRLRARAP